MSDAPYWLAFGDIHDDISRFGDIPELGGTSGILVTGDMTLAGGIKQAKRVLEPIAKASSSVLAQIGNMDRAEVTGWLEDQGWNLHARARELFSGVFAIGVGCSPPTPFGTPSEFSEQRLADWMEQALAEARLYAEETGITPSLVLVAHTPPHASACDRLHSGAPVGSTAVREFIEHYQPDLCLCGHIHESRAEDYIGKTHIINPGALVQGGYVILRQTEQDGRTTVSAELKVLP